MMMNRKRRKGGLVLNPPPIQTLVVLGSGGHTTEMIHLLTSIQHHEYFAPLNYVVAETDVTSIRRLEAFATAVSNKDNNFEGKGEVARTYDEPIVRLPPQGMVYKIPRAREVGQSYLSSIFTTFYSLLYTAKLVLFTTRPDLLIINGPGTCLPIAIWTFVARLLGISYGNIVFIESFCRVKSLSLTGKVLWKIGIVDLFLVHWPELLKNVSGKKRWNKVTDDVSQEMVLVDCFLGHGSKEKVI